MKLTDIQLDAISEIVNMGTGKAANVLNKMFESRIQLQVPAIKIVKSTDIATQMQVNAKESVSAVNLAFRGRFAGIAKLIFSTESAAKLVTVFAEEDTEEEEMDEIRSTTLAEIGNIVLNSLVGAIGNILELMLDYSIPTYSEGDYSVLLKVKNSSIDDYTLLAHTKFKMDDGNIEGDFVLIFEIGSLGEFLSLIDEYIDSLEEEDE
jgi:chemotaxis protein CheC